MFGACLDFSKVWTTAPTPGWAQANQEVVAEIGPGRTGLMHPRFWDPTRLPLSVR